MHYKRKRTAKVKSTSFYLPQSYLRQLDLIAPNSSKIQGFKGF